MGCRVRRCLLLLPKAESDGVDPDERTNIGTSAWIIMATVNNLFAGMGTRHLEVPSAVRSMSPNCNFRKGSIDFASNSISRTTACKAQDCGLLAHGIKRTPSGQPLYT